MVGERGRKVRFRASKSYWGTLLQYGIAALYYGGRFTMALSGLQSLVLSMSGEAPSV